MYKPDKQDVLFVSGALSIVVGISLHDLSHGLIAAGIFLILPPALELLSGFLRGLRS